MSFANPLFLFALAGIAAPVLIHLLTRDRVVHASFSTLRFFTKGAKTVVRRKKFQETLLLILRTACIALLVFVFARPYLGAKPVDARREFTTARVVVVDVSSSMRRAGLPEAIKSQAGSAIGSLTPGQDAAGLITFSDTPSVAIPLSDKIADAKAAVDAIAPGYGGTNIAEALLKANEMLGGIRAKQKEIVLISDLQRKGWSYFQGDWKLSSDVKLTIQQVKPSSAAASPSIVEMHAPSSLVLDKQPASIAARIANYSDQPRDKVNVALMLGGVKVDSQQINLKANGTAVLRFRHVFDAPGDNPGSIVVRDDASTPDNTVYFNARTIPRIPVLLINGRPSSDPQVDAAFFLNKALVPTDSSPFAVTVVTADKVTPQDVSPSTVVVLADVGDIPAAVAGALSSLLDRGGGIFLLPGDQVKAAAFNSELGAVSPCKLRQVLDAHPANGATAESLTRIDFNHPIFDVFSLPHHGDLSLTKIARYWETSDTQLSQILARFGDGRPAIIERHIGKGTSLAFVSAIDPKWNDFAYQSVFLPFVHQAVRYLAVQTGRQTVFTSGDALPVPDGDTVKDPQGKLVPPSQTVAGKSLYQAGAPGFYTTVNAQGQPDICYAVNGNLSESDPATVASDEIAAAIGREPGETSGALGDTASEPQLAAGKKDAGLWWYLLAGLLVLTFAELIVGNKTLRH